MTDNNQKNKKDIIITTVSESVDEHAAFILSGEHLDLAKRIWWWHPPIVAETEAGHTNHPLPEMPPSDAEEGQFLGERSTHFAMACVPGEPSLMYNVRPAVLWLETDGVYSAPYIINRPILYTLGESEILPGQMLTCYGRNLCAADEYADEQYLVLFKNADGVSSYKGQMMGIMEQVLGDYKPYLLHVRVPDEIPPGEYTVSVNLLNCGFYGFSNEKSVRVLAQSTLSFALPRMDAHARCLPLVNYAEPPVVVDLTSKVRADAVTDNHAVIQAAIDTLSPHAGIIVLPPGIIGLSRTLHVRENVVMQGSQTTLTVPRMRVFQNEHATVPDDIPLFDSPPWLSGFAGDYKPFMRHNTLVWLDTNAGLSHLTIQAGPGVDTCVTVATETGDSVENAFLTDCEIINTYGLAYEIAQSARFGFDCGGVHIVSGTNGFVMKRCRVTAMEPIFAHAAKQPHQYMRIEGCDFTAYPSHGGNNVMIRTLHNAVICYNHFKDGGRAFTNSMGMSNSVILGNTVCDTEGLHNAGEIFMSETGLSLYQGACLSLDATSMRVDFDLPGNDALTATGVVFYAYILFGRGMGQYRRIISNTKDTLCLESPWRTEPDHTSRIAVKLMSNENLWVRNHIENTRGALQFIYGAGMNHVVAGNEFYNAAGITAFGLSHGEGGDVAPVGFCFVYGNRLINSTGIRMLGSLPDCENADISQQGSAGSYLYAEEDVCNLFGNTVRRNQIISASMPDGANQYYNIWMMNKTANVSGGITFIDGRFNVAEANYLYNAPGGIQSVRSETLSRDNLFQS